MDPNNQDIPGMTPDPKYSEKTPILSQDSNKVQKEMEKTKKELEKLKSFIIKKYNFIQAISILPPQSIKIFIDEEEVPKESEKHIQLYVIVPEDKFKEIPKIKEDIINDTDVKRMPRLELKERLRSIIFQYISEATALAGLKKNVLNVQPYLLTEFWESVKDANPVMFTFIRDGVPLYDRGTFMPWKALLKMGKLKPSPEAIDMFMSMGDKTVKRAKKALLEIVVHDIYWSIITPGQALLMLYGLPPPTPKQIANEMENIFVKKEKMLEQKYVDILRKIIKIYKDYEHETITEIKGVEIDKLIKDTEDYLKRLEELRKQIEKDAQGKTIEQIYNDVFDLLKQIIGKKTQNMLIDEFEKKFVKTGKFSPQSLRILNDIIKAKAEFKKGKSNAHKVDNARKNATLLINDLIEYSQRCDLVSLEKGRMIIKYKEKDKDAIAELLSCDSKSFLFRGNSVVKLTDKISPSNMEEVSESVNKQKEKKNVEISTKIFELLRKELGDFEIIL